MRSLFRLLATLVAACVWSASGSALAHRESGARPLVIGHRGALVDLADREIRLDGGRLTDPE